MRLLLSLPILLLLLAVVVCDGGRAADGCGGGFFSILVISAGGGWRGVNERGGGSCLHVHTGVGFRHLHVRSDHDPNPGLCGPLLSLPSRRVQFAVPIVFWPIVSLFSRLDLAHLALTQHGTSGQHVNACLPRMPSPVSGGSGGGNAIPSRFH